MFHAVNISACRAVAALLFSMLACAGMANAKAQDNIAAATAESNGTATSPAGGDSNYKLGSGDKVRIIVFNEPTLSGEFAVADNGSLGLPLIGEVQAGGRSVREVINDVEHKLGDGYLRAPKVSLDVLTYRPFYILGEVSKPGEYSFVTGLTVMNAVARAEGFTYRANKRRVFLKRAGQPNEQALDLTADLSVQPGDTIRIGERYF